MPCSLTMTVFKGQKDVSRVLKMVSPVNNVKIVFAYYQNHKNSLENSCHFIYNLLKVNEV